jgi:hypothetical protein
MPVPLQAYYDKLKTEQGGSAAILWLICGTIEFYFYPSARLLSWQTPVYFLAGMFFAAGVIGGLSYLLVRGISKALISSGAVSSPTAPAAKLLNVFGVILFLVQAAILFVLARWTVRSMF